ncbi:MAG: hypothetical protein EAZ85_10625 [Bacteroidetes bacterium]|nr:MAG: hypothetical protein EAZ85_10625 [Bacteroidota bacterium]
MKKYTLNGLLCFLFLLISHTISAQNPVQNIFDEQRKKFEEMMKNQKQDMDKTKKQQEQIFKEFRKQQNNEFLKTLKNQKWKVIKPEPNIETDEKPKPNKIPVAELTEEEKRNNIEVQTIPRLELPPIPVPIYATPTIVRVMVDAKKTTKQLPNLSLNYLNIALQLPYPDNFKVEKPKNINPKAIADYWQEMSEKDYLYFLQQIIKMRVEMQLNDWAYYRLLENIGEQIMEKDKNLTTLFTWFMLLQSGYNVKIGFENESLYLLYPAQTTIFRNTYYRIDKQPFYVLNAPKSQMQVSIYENNFAEAKLIPNLSIVREPKISTESTKKTLKFRYLSKEYSVEVAYNPTIIQLYQNYPLTDMKIYFEGKPTESVISSLEKSLKELLKGKNEWESVNFLLAFVQKAFEYKTDQEQFNAEKPFFIEEILHYPFSDCEDRSVFFAYLVDKLLGLEVVGLDYPGHIATAVKFNQELNGDFVMHNNKKYLICDPTYIGAFAGEAMTDLKNVKAQIIEIKR